MLMLQSPLSTMEWGRGMGLSQVKKINTALGVGIGERWAKIKKKDGHNMGAKK